MHEIERSARQDRPVDRGGDFLAEDEHPGPPRARWTAAMVNCRFAGSASCARSGIYRLRPAEGTAKYGGISSIGPAQPSDFECFGELAQSAFPTARRQLAPTIAIFAFSAASIFRLVLCVILRSVCCDGTAQNPISQPVRFLGAHFTVHASLRDRASAGWSDPSLIPVALHQLPLQSCPALPACKPN